MSPHLAFSGGQTRVRHNNVCYKLWNHQCEQACGGANERSRLAFVAIAPTSIPLDHVWPGLSDADACLAF